MRRRDFIKALAGGAAALPHAARAQQTVTPVIGIIGGGSRSGFDDLLNEFRLGLKDFGYVEGQTVAIDYAFAAGRYDQLSQLASDLARSQSRLEAENAALRHQLIGLRRKVRGRAWLTNNDRWFLIQLYRWFRRFCGSSRSFRRIMASDVCDSARARDLRFE